MQYILLPIAMILVGGFAADKARASELEISPVLLKLAPGQTSATVEVRNWGDAPVTIQARPFLWAQVQDDDLLTPTQDMILSPPIFTVPAGAVQTMRLLLRGNAGIKLDRDRSYRLLLEEVPTAHTQNGEVMVTLRMSVPIFAVFAPSVPALAWTAARSPDGAVVLTATNTGRAYVRVNGLDVTLADGSHPRLIARGKSPYILSGVQRHWTIQASGQKTVSSPLRLRVTTQIGVSDLVLAP